MTTATTKADKTAKTIEKMKAYALKHYERGGDTMVECWETSDYADMIGRASSLREAWTTLRSVIAVYRDRQADARNCAF